MYSVLVADPCWRYRNVKTGGNHTSGAAQKYPTMAVGEIAALPIKQIMERHAVCALWATTPLGADPFTVLSAWGFEFKTKWYWHKIGRKGTGYWTRGEVEEVLIGVRGTVRAWRSSLSNYLEGLEDAENVLHTTPAGHSQKPEAVQDRLDALQPLGARVELFATRHRPGWDCYGLSLDPTNDFRDPEFWRVLRSRASEYPPVPTPASNVAAGDATTSAVE